MMVVVHVIPNMTLWIRTQERVIIAGSGFTLLTWKWLKAGLCFVGDVNAIVHGQPRKHSLLVLLVVASWRGTREGQEPIFFSAPGLDYKCGVVAILLVEIESGICSPRHLFHGVILT